MNRLKKRLEALDAVLNPPPAPKVIWVEEDPAELEVNAVYVRFRNAAEHAATVEMQARAVD
jgi:hypothetical protein